MKQFALIFLIFLTFGTFSYANDIIINSPNGDAQVVVKNQKKEISYHLRYKNREVVLNSSLGIEVNKINLGINTSILSQERTQGVEKIKDGQNPETAYPYNEVILKLHNDLSPIVCFLEIRLFNNGLALRYRIPSTDTLLINGESTSWKIPEKSTIWYQENTDYYEGMYYGSRVDAIAGKTFGPPITFQTPEKIYAAITEAALLNYSGMSLYMDSGNLLRAHFKNDIQGWKIKDTAISPWRVILLSQDLNGLVKNNLVEVLNAKPSSLYLNANWIKPGNAAWSYFVHGNVTTEEIEKDFVDKGAELGFEYNVVDAGWESEWPDKWATLSDLVKYAATKNVKIWVWKSYTSLKDENIRKEFFKQLHDVGAVGVKIDFIDREGIDQVRFYEDALKDAATEKIMIDFHGADKPTGISRTFPNELTREAIFGQEWRTPNEHGIVNHTIVPFTRFLAGPADYTPCVLNSKFNYGSSWPHQFALPIIFFSPLICWPEHPETYLKSPAASLIRTMPTTWDETFVLPQSKIGELAAFVRRKDSTWYIALANGDEEKELSISLGFLQSGNYEAEIFCDDFDNPDNLLISRTGINSKDSLHIYLRPKGGFVARLKKSSHILPSLSINAQNHFLTKPLKITIRSNKINQPIHYTLDGRIPDVQSPLYTVPIRIDGKCILTALLFDGDQSTGTLITRQFNLVHGPAISPEQKLFMDKDEIVISKSQSSGEIHYTLDGTTPTVHDKIYKDPIKINESKTISATIFNTAGFASETTTVLYEIAPPHRAEKIDNSQPGLIYKYYRGSWEYLPDFKSLKELRSGKIGTVQIDSVTNDEIDFAICYDGYYLAAKDGIYVFYTISDDGSQCFIDGEKIVDNDGSHGDLEKSGAICLAKGLHRIKVTYFQNSSGKSLKVFVKTPGGEKKEIQQESLFHN